MESNILKLLSLFAKIYMAYIVYIVLYIKKCFILHTLKSN